MARKKRKSEILETDLSVDYFRLLSDLKAILGVEKIWGERALNQIKIQITWKLGERILQEFDQRSLKEKKIETLCKKLSMDLNISRTHLFLSVQFYRCYPFPQHISPELSWSHYRHLIVIEKGGIRRFYENQAISNKWSVRELAKRIQEGEHKKLEKAKIALPPPHPDIPKPGQIIKNIYNFNFVDLPSSYSERDLEEGLINQMGRFLLELGYGFSFLGSQHKIVISGQSHHIDLVFFHIHLACFVLVDLKIEKFQDSFIGQMNKYLTYFEHRENLPYMRRPVGILICKSKDHEEVFYALGGMTEKIFVSEYQLRLPSREQILGVLKKGDKQANRKVSIRKNRVLKELSKRKRPFRVRDYMDIAGVSLATAQRDVQTLVAEGILLQEGVGRITRYRIPPGNGH